MELRGLNFPWCKISYMFEVSRWTVMRRVQEYRLSDLQEFSNISDDRIDDNRRLHVTPWFYNYW